MMHVLLIVVHATAAVAAFGLGSALLIRPPKRKRDVRIAVYLAAIWAAVVALIAVVLLDWSGLAPGKRIAFAVLVVLGVVLLVRSALAARVASRRPARWLRSFLAHIGFVLISLFDGFCIVTAIDLRMPAAVVVAAAVAGVVAGALVTRRAVRRTTSGTFARGWGIS